jgi:hypothetical protein
VVLVVVVVVVVVAVVVVVLVVVVVVVVVVVWVWCSPPPAFAFGCATIKPVQGRPCVAVASAFGLLRCCGAAGMVARSGSWWHPPCVCEFACLLLLRVLNPPAASAARTCGCRCHAGAGAALRGGLRVRGGWIFSTQRSRCALSM